MKTPAVSVVMTTYNAPQFLNESIESVINQTFSDFEFIIVDDGSTENNCDIIRSYGDPRIVLIENEHNFIGSLNRGFKTAKGKYIARMDADDRMHPERLEKQYNYMEEHPEIGVCGSWFQGFGSNDSVYRLTGDEKALLIQMLSGNAMCHPSTFIRKSVLEKLPGSTRSEYYRPDYIYAEDYKLWCELATEGVRFTNIQEILLFYRFSDNQVTKHHADEMYRKTRQIQLEYFGAVTARIVREEPAFFELVNGLIRLCNEKRMPYQRLMEITRLIYLTFLEKAT